MFPPPLPKRPRAAAQPPLLRILGELAARAVAADLRERLEGLHDEPVGFVARALGQMHREIQAAGREWTEADVHEFVEVRLPEALDAAELAKGGGA